MLAASHPGHIEMIDLITTVCHPQSTFYWIVSYNHSNVVVLPLCYCYTLSLHLQGVPKILALR